MYVEASELKIREQSESDSIHTIRCNSPKLVEVEEIFHLSGK
jgi:hypothetical protein